MAIYLLNQQKTLLIRPMAMRRRLNRVLRALELQDAELSVTITDDERIRALNLQYRGLDKATNVLAFAMEEGQPVAGPKRILGDIVVSADTIAREAGPLGYTCGEMLYFYIIHGLLHLLGYDHEKSEEEDKRQQDETLRLWSLIRHDL